MIYIVVVDPPCTRLLKLSGIDGSELCSRFLTLFTQKQYSIQMAVASKRKLVFVYDARAGEVYVFSMLDLALLRWWMVSYDLDPVLGCIAYDEQRDYLMVTGQYSVGLPIYTWEGTRLHLVWIGDTEHKSDLRPYAVGVDEDGFIYVGRLPRDPYVYVFTTNGRYVRRWKTVDGKSVDGLCVQQRVVFVYGRARVQAYSTHGALLGILYCNKHLGMTTHDGQIYTLHRNPTDRSYRVSVLCYNSCDLKTN